MLRRKRGIPSSPPGSEPRLARAKQHLRIGANPCVILGTIAVISCSLWALFGAGLRHFLHNPKLQKGINSVLALLLVYTAISLMFL